VLSRTSAFNAVPALKGSPQYLRRRRPAHVGRTQLSPEQCLKSYAMSYHIELPESHHYFHALLVDDDDFMLEMIEDMLHDLGVANVTTAVDGKKAFAAFEAATPVPDIIICDINMPNTDGFQLMELLAKKRPDCGVILVSGLDKRFVDSATLMAKFHHLNILGALHKPVDKHALAALMSKRRLSSS
jgi:CheY-like chemotaxis protein